MKKFLWILSCFVFFACKNSTDFENSNYKIIDCPQDISERAFAFAEIYKNSDTEYELGGQDPCRTIKLDCSGLVIMCYKYALVDTNYTLLMPDMTANYMYKNAATLTDNPQRGNLIFMINEKNGDVEHIAIFDHKDPDGTIHFIDSSTKGDGVSKRSYSPDDTENYWKFKAFGIMRLKK
ncbi:NlpC/P60 family protein [uncultured Treponema sp.]|uniref:NlpC/P60 family protein n=1 Tax=uncultured Treponema sp. TaxID=162155 RepID=UPI00258D92EC|nr:NlpC/P60 family protein [uncultured Treponema sp.]